MSATCQLFAFAVCCKFIFLNLIDFLHFHSNMNYVYWVGFVDLTEGPG